MCRRLAGVAAVAAVAGWPGGREKGIFDFKRVFEGEGGEEVRWHGRRRRRGKSSSWHSKFSG